MEIRSYSKFDIAVGQIDTAIGLYIQGADPFSSLTLAGAGEEILRGFLLKSGKTPVIEDLGAAIAEIKKIHTGQPVSLQEGKSILNKPRNSAKHLDIKDDEIVQADPIYNAHDMIMRAVSNYHRLTSHYTTNMISFLQQAAFKPRKA